METRDLIGLYTCILPLIQNYTCSHHHLYNINLTISSQIYQPLLLPATFTFCTWFFIQKVSRNLQDVGRVHQREKGMSQEHFQTNNLSGDQAEQ